MFNYRIAEATYGIALKPMRDCRPTASSRRASRIRRAGRRSLMRKAGPFNPTRIAFQTPPVTGVVNEHPYKVTVVLRERQGTALQTIEKTYASELDQSVLPERPLAIGPGYQKNIDGSTTAYPASIGRTRTEPPRVNSSGEPAKSG